MYMNSQRLSIPSTPPSFPPRLPYPPNSTKQYGRTVLNKLQGECNMKEKKSLVQDSDVQGSKSRKKTYRLSCFLNQSIGLREFFCGFVVCPRLRFVFLDVSYTFSMFPQVFASFACQCLMNHPDQLCHAASINGRPE